MTLPASIASARSQRGLTLVELMVALVMGMVLLAGVATVFVANKQSYRLQDSLARLQENGRFAIEFLERDIRMAGYTGCKNLVLKANTVADPPQTTTCSTKGMTLDGGEPVDGFDNVGSNSPADPLNTGALQPPRPPKLDTDILRLLLGGGQGAKVIQHKENSAQLKVTAFADLADEDIVMVVDSTCENGSIFQITNFANKSINHSEVVHNTGNTTSPSNCVKDLGQTYMGGRIIKFVRAAYFVADTGRLAAGQPVFALYRLDSTRVGTPTLQELIEGVEDMQILFGVGSDADNDGVVDTIAYKDATAVKNASEWPAVVNVRVQLLLSSADPNALWKSQEIDVQLGRTSVTEYVNIALTPADKAMRQDYNTTTTVRNRVN